MKKIFFTLITVGIVAALGAFAFLLFRDQEAPTITLSPEIGIISPDTVFTLTVEDAQSDIASLSLQLHKKDQYSTIFEKTWEQKKNGESLSFTLKKIPLQNGPLELIVKAVDGSFAGFGKGNSVLRTYSFTVDTIPPRIQVQSRTPYVRKGGSAIISYSLSEDVIKSGVAIGDYFFPAYRQANGLYYCLFSFPYHMDVKAFSGKIIAKDLAGNSNAISLDAFPVNVVFRNDTLRLPDSFLDKKSQEFMDVFPGNMTSLERYLLVNTKMRKENSNTLLELAQNTSPTILWSGAFLNLRGASSHAKFADHRFYKYNGKTVDEQTHLGIDMASVANAKVVAGNTGTIIYADDLGIFGNCIIIDHGLGLQSLYSHLSRIDVRAGQNVKRGERIGLTGKTGLAGGDHLHLGFMVNGLPVQPLEWLDKKWIRDNITTRLQ